MPQKIYHYCTIDTLKKILINKTIRFSRFDLMDDQTETDGLPEMLKKNYFLSCWVSDIGSLSSTFNRKKNLLKIFEKK